jgi:uroporphyrinogen-III decarboxylase
VEVERHDYDLSPIWQSSDCGREPGGVDICPRLFPFLRELPRGAFVVELDGISDIRKAREILADRCCLKGDVPSALLALGDKGQVETYCRELIDFMGRDGGFILGSGCEVPLTAKPENVAALIRVARR